MYSSSSILGLQYDRKERKAPFRKVSPCKSKTRVRTLLFQVKGLMRIYYF